MTKTPIVGKAKKTSIRFKNNQQYYKSHKRIKYEQDLKRRYRLRNSLIRKLKSIVDELIVRVGLQASILSISSLSTLSRCHTFGTQPLNDIMENLSSVIVSELEKHSEEENENETELVNNKNNNNLDKFVLPPLMFNGERTPVRQMLQSQLRSFIPLMLKYSTGRSKPGWGREDTHPPWWPKDIPWANVRSDTRTEEQKMETSWTKVLQDIVINCYQYHGREELLMLDQQNESEAEDANNDEDDKLKPTCNIERPLVTTLAIVLQDCENQVEAKEDVNIQLFEVVQSGVEKKVENVTENKETDVKIQTSVEKNKENVTENAEINIKTDVEMSGNQSICLAVPINCDVYELVPNNTVRIDYLTPNTNDSVDINNVSAVENVELAPNPLL